MKPCALLLTTMNEVDGLKAIWDRLPLAVFSRVLVVDAGSNDGTLEFLSDKSCEIVLQKLPGRGSAIVEGMEHIGDGAVMLMACDGNDDPKYIPKFLEKLEEGYDLVAGSRFTSGGKSDNSDDPYGFRRFGNRFLAFLANLLFGAQITDPTYGYRAIRTDAWKQMNINVRGGQIDFIMLIRSARLHLKVVEIPIIEGKRVGGQSKYRSATKTGWLLLKLIFSEILR